jgi:hypothetical protein
MTCIRRGAVISVPPFQHLIYPLQLLPRSHKIQAHRHNAFPTSLLVNLPCRRIWFGHPYPTSPLRLTTLGSYTYKRLDKTKALLLVVDIQVGLYHQARDQAPEVYRNALLAHSAIGPLFNLPTILTTSAETGNLLPSRYSTPGR